MNKTKLKQRENGVIPEGWEEFKVGDLIDIKHGFAFKGEFFSDNLTNDILLTPGNFKIGGGFKDGKFKYYKGEYPEEYALKENDIIITMTDLSKQGDTLGYSAKVPNAKGKRYLHNQRLGLVIFKSKRMNCDFLYWLMRDKNYQQFIVNSSSGSTVKHTSPNRIKEYVFLAPVENAEQRAIAKILSDLDAKIELNHQMNKTLEQIAQAIFKQWFVDNSDSTWPKRQLGDICEKITKGTTPTTLKKSFVETGINFIKVESIDDFGNFLKDKFAYIDSNTNLLLSRSMIQEGDILYTIAGTIGRAAVASFEVLPANTNQAVAIIRLKDKLLYLSYIRLLLKTSSLSEKFRSKVVHAVQPNLSLGEISGTEILIPDERVLAKFNRMIDPIFLEIRQNAAQINILSRIRDSLLPRLMSGKIRVGIND